MAALLPHDVGASLSTHCGHSSFHDGATLALVPSPQRRKAQLDRLEGVRREMSRVYRDMESGKRDSQDGSRLVYVLTQIAKVLELTEIERRVDALENRVG